MRCPHGSVGAIIYDAQGRILMGYRATEPFGWAVPAGHLEIPGDGIALDKDAARNAVTREVLEEVGLTVTGAELLWHGILQNFCRRPKDQPEKYNEHEWWVFQCGVEDLAKLRVDPGVFREWRWVDRKDIPRPLVPAWEMIFKTLGFLK